MRLIAPVAGLALAALIVPAAGAQQPSDSGEGSGIITRKLEPLMPHGTIEGEAEREAAREAAREAEREAGRLAPRDDTFKPAPFSAPGGPVAPERIEPVETTMKPGARVRQLDKMTGQAETVEIAAGDETMIDRLRVRLEACRAPEDNAEHGTRAYLTIWDTQTPGAEPVFSGWMFAESPALSAMDHPRYDLWVTSCTTSSAEASAESR